MKWLKFLKAAKKRTLEGGAETGALDDGSSQQKHTKRRSMQHERRERTSIEQWHEARKTRTSIDVCSAFNVTTTERLSVCKAGITLLINRTYIVIKHIGSGTSGQVKLAFNLRSKKLVAIKAVRKIGCSGSLPLMGGGAACRDRDARSYDGRGSLGSSLQLQRGGQQQQQMEQGGGGLLSSSGSSSVSAAPVAVAAAPPQQQPGPRGWRASSLLRRAGSAGAAAWSNSRDSSSSASPSPLRGFSRAAASACSDPTGPTDPASSRLRRCQPSDDLVREIAILKRLSHPNIVQLVEVIDDPASECLLLVMGYVEGATLQPPQLGPGRWRPVAEEVAWRHARDVLCGLEYLHCHGVVHGDLKPANFIQDSLTGVVRILDFGSAVLHGRAAGWEEEGLRGAHVPLSGTPGFRAPESLAAGYRPSFELDMWALGVCLYLWVYGELPFKGSAPFVVYENIRSAPLVLSPHASLSPQLTDLLTRLLEKDPSRRLTVQQAVQHPWVSAQGLAPLRTSSPLVLAARLQIATAAAAVCQQGPQGHQGQQGQGQQAQRMDVLGDAAEAGWLQASFEKQQQQSQQSQAPCSKGAGGGGNGWVAPAWAGQPGAAAAAGQPWTATAAAPASALPPQQQQPQQPQQLRPSASAHVWEGSAAPFSAFGGPFKGLFNRPSTAAGQTATAAVPASHGFATSAAKPPTAAAAAAAAAAIMMEVERPWRMSATSSSSPSCLRPPVVPASSSLPAAAAASPSTPSVMPRITEGSSSTTTTAAASFNNNHARRQLNSNPAGVGNGGNAGSKGNGGGSGAGRRPSSELWELRRSVTDEELQAAISSCCDPTGSGAVLMESIFEEVTFPAKHQLIRAGDFLDRIYLITAGEVEIYHDLAQDGPDAPCPHKPMIEGLSDPESDLDDPGDFLNVRLPGARPLPQLERLSTGLLNMTAAAAVADRSNHGREGGAAAGSSAMSDVAGCGSGAAGAPSPPAVISPFAGQAANADLGRGSGGGGGTADSTSNNLVLLGREASSSSIGLSLRPCVQNGHLIVASKGPGDSLGFAGMLPGGELGRRAVWSVNVRARTQVTAFAARIESLHKLARTHPQVEPLLRQMAVQQETDLAVAEAMRSLRLVGGTAAAAARELGTAGSRAGGGGAAAAAAAGSASGTVAWKQATGAGGGSATANGGGVGGGMEAAPVTAAAAVQVSVSGPREGGKACRGAGAASAGVSSEGESESACGTAGTSITGLTTAGSSLASSLAPRLAAFTTSSYGCGSSAAVSGPYGAAARGEAAAAAAAGACSSYDMVGESEEVALEDTMMGSNVYLRASCQPWHPENLRLSIKQAQKTAAPCALASIMHPAPTDPPSRPRHQGSKQPPSRPRSLSLWWLRGDLRLADNEALTGACRHADALLPVFCFDPRDVLPRSELPRGLGVPKMGPQRCRFLLEALTELQGDLQQHWQQQQPPQEVPVSSRDPLAAALHLHTGGSSSSSGCSGTGDSSPSCPSSSSSPSGSGLVVRWGLPEEVLPELMEQVLMSGAALEAAAGTVEAAVATAFDKRAAEPAAAAALAVVPEEQGAGEQRSGGGAHTAMPYLGHVSLHHHMLPGREAAEVERATAAALKDWADRKGVGFSLHAYWDRTLYHPDDLPYHLYGSSGSDSKGSSSGRWLPAVAIPRGANGGDGQAPPPPMSVSLDPERFRALPNVLTEFRKVTQAATRVRPPLPPPFSASSAPAHTTTTITQQPHDSTPQPVPPPLLPPPQPPTPPPSSTHTSAAVVMGELPSTVLQVYEAAGALGALRRLEALVGQDYSALVRLPLQPPPPLPHAAAAEGDDVEYRPAGRGGDVVRVSGLNSGLAGYPADPRTAFPFRGGHRSGMERLRSFVWGDGQLPAAAPVAVAAVAGFGQQGLQQQGQQQGSQEEAAPGQLHAKQQQQRRQGPEMEFGFGATTGSGILVEHVAAEEAGASAAPCHSPAPASPAPPSLQSYTNTRSQAAGVAGSTKLSPFVALGCITPRQIYHEVEKVRLAAAAAAAATAVEAPLEAVDAAAAGAAATASRADLASAAAAGWRSGDPQTGAAAASATACVLPECDWLAMHLCIRDFFTFTALKSGEAMMQAGGIACHPADSWRRDFDAFTRWARGTTGFPFVDACMRELATTGWMSNRGRQNVASFLTKELGIDWRWGAELFECLLLDSDVAVNYCNWNYFAGVGNDPRNRHFKTVTQGIKYDEGAVLSVTWFPELAALPPALRHQPWTMSQQEAEVYGVVLGRDYPPPMVDPASQVGQLRLPVPGSSPGNRGRKKGNTVAAKSTRKPPVVEG